MFADFCLHMLQNDMKVTVQKNNLRVQILYQILDPPKKWRLIQQ